MTERRIWIGPLLSIASRAFRKRGMQFAVDPTGTAITVPVPFPNGELSLDHALRVESFGWLGLWCWFVWEGERKSWPWPWLGFDHSTRRLLHQIQQLEAPTDG